MGNGGTGSVHDVERTSGDVDGDGLVVGDGVEVSEEEDEDTRDLVHEIVEEERNGAPHDARRHHTACLIGFVRKPANLMEASDTLELGRLSNAQCKVMLSVMNVTGCKNSNLAAKKYILACKMVQRQVTLQSLFDITSRLHLVQPQEQRADGGTPDAEVSRIKSLPKTSASAEPARPGQGMLELVNWARGDVPVFVNNEVLVGEPSLESNPTATLLQGSTSAPTPVATSMGVGVGVGVDGTVGVAPMVVPGAPGVGSTGIGRIVEGGAAVPGLDTTITTTTTTIPVSDAAIPTDLKRRISRPSRSADQVPKRRRRLSSSGDTTNNINDNNNNNNNTNTTAAELHIKEAEAQSASARAVSDTLKAIKESESMMSACEHNNETRVFYKEVIATLRQKMASILGMQLV